MFWFIIGILVTIVAAVCLGFKEITIKNVYGREETVVKWTVNKKQWLALLGLLLCLFGCITRVPANSVGIVYSPFDGTRQETLSEGIHTKFIFDKVYKISTEVQTTTVESLTTQTMDAQYVSSTLDIKYSINVKNAYLIFKNYRTLDRVSNTLIVPTTQRVLELITTRYNVIDILGESRADIYMYLEKELAEEFAVYGIDFFSISITDMDAGEALENAIAEEAIAKKNVETAKQNLLKAETEAKQKSVIAQAEQDAAKIEAETKLIKARADKEANELLSQSLTDDILRKAWIDKWNGLMPTYYAGTGDGMSIIFDAGITN